jgi:hypothetical protein
VANGYPLGKIEEVLKGSTADGETQRGIARAIFKRIEIKKENRVTIEWAIPDSDGGNSTFQREEWRDGRDLNPRPPA